MAREGVGDEDGGAVDRRVPRSTGKQTGPSPLTAAAGLVAGWVVAVAGMVAGLAMMVEAGWGSGAAGMVSAVLIPEEEDESTGVTSLDTCGSTVQTNTRL